MSIPLTSELFARAIIASAISFGADSIEALTTRNRFKRACLAPAAIGLASAADVPLQQAAGVLGLRTDNILKAQARGSVQFRKAVEASREAAAYHLRGMELKARAQPCAEPAGEMPGNPVFQAPTISIPVGTDVVVFDVEPAPALEKSEANPKAPTNTATKTARPAVKPAVKPARQGRAIPKGARFENLGGGVSVIRLKPITDSVLRHARQQAARGVDVDDLADLFGVDADQLRRRLNEGAAA